MTFKLLNRVRMSLTGAAGTGTLTLNTAASGFQSFSAAGMSDGDTTSYVLEDGTPFGTVWEYGIGTYHSSGTLTRDIITKSSAGGSTPVSATANAVLSSTVRAEDLSTNGNVSVVQYTTFQSNSGGTITATLGANPSVGNYLLCMGLNTGLVSPDLTFGTGNVTGAIRAVRSADAATSSFTVATATTGEIVSGVLLEIEGFDPSRFSPFSVAENGWTTGTSGTQVLSIPGALMVAVVVGDSNTVTVTSPSPQVNNTSGGSTLVVAYDYALGGWNGIGGHLASAPGADGFSGLVVSLVGVQV